MPDRPFSFDRRAVLAAAAATVPLTVSSTARAAARSDGNAALGESRCRLADRLSIMDASVAVAGIRDGSASVVPALNELIAFANARSPQNVERKISQATEIYFPPGQYLIDRAVEPITVNGGVEFVGSGKASQLIVTHTGLAFNFDPTQQTLHPPYDVSGGFDNFAILYPAPAEGARFSRFATSTQSFHRNLTIRNVPCLVQLGKATSTIYVGPATFGGKAISQTLTQSASGHRISNVVGTCANVPGVLFDCVRVKGVYADEQINVFPEGVQIPAINTTSKVNVSIGRHAWQFGDGSTDTAWIGGTYVGFDCGLNINVQRHQSVINIWLPGTIFDFCSCYAIKIVTAPTANCGVVRGHDLYLNAWDGIGVYASAATGSIFNVELSGTVAATASHGIELSGAGLSNIDIHHTKFFGSGRTDAKAAGIFVHTNATDFRITDNNVQHESFGFLGWQPKWGIYVGADLDHYNISRNRGAGSTAAYLFEANTAASVSRIVSENRAANYAGDKTGTAPQYDVGPSGSTMTNKSGFRMEVWLKISAAGKVSATHNGKVVNAGSGTTLFQTLQIDRGDTWSATYDTLDDRRVTVFA